MRLQHCRCQNQDLSFADTSASGAEAVFNDVTIAVDGGDSPIKAGSLAFKGLEMTDSGANFSQMTLSDLSVAPDGDVFNISSVQLTNPSPELGAWVSSLMGQGEPAAFPAMDKLSFDGLNLNGLAVAAEDIDNLDVFELGAVMTVLPLMHFRQIFSD